MRIRTHVIMMAVAILLPVAMAAGLALQKIRNGEREAALRGLAETARATSLIVDREVQGSLLGLRALGHSRSLEMGDLSTFYAEAQALNQTSAVWTLLLDSRGQQLLNTIVPFGTPLPQIQPVRRDEVAQVIATQKPLITDLIVGPATGRLLTFIYAPAAARGGRSYVVAQAFAVDHWKGTALSAKLPGDWIVAVIDRAGRFIARTHRTEELLGQFARPELVAEAATSNDGLIRDSTVDEVRSFNAFTHSSLTGWTIAVAAPAQAIEAPANRVLRGAIAAMILAVAVALLGVAAFGHRFIHAIRQAGQAAVSLGQGRRPQVKPTAVAEINELNQALVEAGGLLEAERESRRAVEAERERLLRSETAAREAAQAQNEAKDQFLAMLGHELRNPLAAISGAVTLLEMGATDGQSRAHYLDIVRRQNFHLVHIVDDLLDVSRLLAGKITLEKTALNLAESVSLCVESLRARNREAGDRIVVHAAPVWVQGDPVRIEQILNNLIGNALKFSSEGEIRVDVHPQDGRAVVQVHDSGEGMAAELLARVFDPFFQGPPPTQRMQSGMGIGLALVKQLVTLHGGEVRAASPGPGRGSTFTFWIPSIAEPQAPSRSGGLGPRSHWRIVYVEDNEDARATTSELLRVFGYEVFEVAEGSSTQAMVLSVQPDAVVLDIGLPDIDGYEVARRLREHFETRHIPLIALTGYGQQSDKEQAVFAGFDAHLVKPVAPDDLIRTIEAVVPAPKEGTAVGRAGPVQQGAKA